MGLRSHVACNIESLPGEKIIRTGTQDKNTCHTLIVLKALSYLQTIKSLHAWLYICIAITKACFDPCVGCLAIKPPHACHVKLI